MQATRVLLRQRSAPPQEESFIVRNKDTFTIMSATMWLGIISFAAGYNGPKLWKTGDSTKPSLPKPADPAERSTERLDSLEKQLKSLKDLVTSKFAEFEKQRSAGAAKS